MDPVTFCYYQERLEFDAKKRRCSPGRILFDIQAGRVSVLADQPTIMHHYAGISTAWPNFLEACRIYAGSSNLP